MVAVKAAFLTNPVTATALLIAAAATLMIDNWEPIGKFFVGLWEGIKSSFASGALFVLEKIRSVTSVSPDFARSSLGLDGLDSAISRLQEITGPAGQNPSSTGPALSNLSNVPGTRTEPLQGRLKIDISGAPPGTRVSQVETSNRGLDFDVDVGMAMVGP